MDGASAWAGALTPARAMPVGDPAVCPDARSDADAQLSLAK
jgi:hypothetical protein